MSQPIATTPVPMPAHPRLTKFAWLSIAALAVVAIIAVVLAL